MSKFTPMMEQYFTIKDEYKNCIVFFRLGDFYEMFFDDAITASKVLDIALTGRDCGMEERAPMCGVPYHSATSYINKLIDAGYRVAVCEQVEDPKLTKNIVKREVTRVVTPGTVLDTGSLDEKNNNYIACIYKDRFGIGLSCADITTGEFTVTVMETEQQLIAETARLLPVEIIINEKTALCETIESVFRKKVTIFEPWAFDMGVAAKKLKQHFSILSLMGLGIEGNSYAIKAAGALIAYLMDTQKSAVKNILTLKLYNRESYMELDITTRRNLELTSTLFNNEKKGSLLWVLDRTRTAMGARLLRKWLNRPLIYKDEINHRLDGVSDLKDSPLQREELSEFLAGIPDMERIMSKLAYKTSNARDLNSLKKAIINLPKILEILLGFTSEIISELSGSFDCLQDIYGLIDSVICEEPPISVRTGGMIKEGVDSELDHYTEAKRNGSVWLLELEAKERELTGIKGLKVKYNKVFGYYIEITNSHLANAPERYNRRQTIANGERFTTPELKEIEEAVLGADEKLTEIEFRIFTETVEKIISHIQRIQKTADDIAVIDTLLSLAEAAAHNNYCKPVVGNGGEIVIKDSRHPVVERLIQDGFIANDIYLNNHSDRLIILTGPNMAGKSTYMRQAALIVLMAQIGSFVPASEAKIDVCDRIFTRVGAYDSLATGQSTFMVEMNEVANILNNATKNSLIVLDEIGRGTSTYDGLSIAWAVMEYIADKRQMGAKTLCATHYHELTELEDKVEGVRNYCMAVSEQGGDIVFLRRIQRGGAGHSYGIHVAALAGIPKRVVARSKEILAVLNAADVVRHDPENEHKMVKYEKIERQKGSKIVVKELLDLKLEKMSPIEAINKLYELQRLGQDADING